MTTAIKRRRGTTTQHSTFTGLEGELTVDTTKNTVVVHNGSTAGGFPLAKENNPTFTGSATFSSGTANGVAYLNGSKVLTTGSALTFDGTNFVLGGGPPTVYGGYKTITLNGGGIGAELDFKINGTLSGYIESTSSLMNFYIPTSSDFSWVINSEQMRLTSTGLGIGTSSPWSKLHVNGASLIRGTQSGYDADGFYTEWGKSSDAMTYFTNSYGFPGNPGGGYIWRKTDVYGSVGELMRLDSSGNLGLGVTPSAWSVNTSRALQLPYGYAALSANYGLGIGTLSSNAYENGNGTWKYVNTYYALNYQQNAVAGNHAWFTAPSGTAGNAISFTQAMTLDASGRLGVGVTSPSYEIDAAGTNGGIRLTQKLDTATAGLNLIGASNQGNLGRINIWQEATGAKGGYIRFDTCPTGTNTFTERMRIDSSGNVLVAKTSVNATVLGAEIRSTGQITSTMAATVNTTETLDVYSTGAAAYRFYVGMGGTVYATNTTISAISDQRYKENVRDLDVGLDAVMALKPRVFDWKEGKGKDIKNDRGFIAQEFEQVFPDLIDEWKDPAPEGEEPYKSVRQDLIPVLVKAIQEQQELINQLTARVEQLEGN